MNETAAPDVSRRVRQMAGYDAGARRRRWLPSVSSGAIAEVGGRFASFRGRVGSRSVREPQFDATRVCRRHLRRVRGGRIVLHMCAVGSGQTHTRTQPARSALLTPLPGSGAALAIDELIDSIDDLAAVRPRRENTVNARPTAKFPLGLSALMTTLEISQAAAMAVIKGHRALTSAQAEAVARVAEVSVADVLAAAHPLPDELARELLEPRWRSVIRSRAAGGDEVEAREELGRSAFALAARGKGSGRELWRQRIQAVLAAESA